MTRRRHFDAVLAAGGTGGHMFPAHVLGRELCRRGHSITLISDIRGMRFKSLFKDIDCHEVPSATLAGRGALGRVKALVLLAQGVLAARRQLKRINPAVVVGFGGYPSLPTLLAAMTLGIPTCIHEQNAVLGRVNRLLCRFVRRIALSFEGTRKIPAGRDEKIVVTGNPVRPEILAIGEKPYPSLDDSRYLNLLVLGGSQGATILSTVVPGAVSTLSKALRRRLQVFQQCRQEDISRVEETYREFGVKATLATFIDDIPEALATAHLVIARAGASTVTELAAAGRPSVLVPLPSAMDDHQSANALELGETGGAWVIREQDFGTATLAKRLQNLANNDERLRAAALRARRAAKPAAAHDLADMVEQVAIAGGWVPEPFYEGPRRKININKNLDIAASDGAAEMERQL